MKFLKYYNSGEFGIQLRAVIRCIQFPEKHFEKQLRRAMVTGDSQEVLIRTLVTRSGIDIKNIDRVFSEKTGWSLEGLIRNEFNCSSHENSLGWVRDALISLLKNY
ncbi:Annexin D6 [Dendrobium catenatum]|uniref:Annexin D6 n=2 Tax=Dendrobium catenatum TaxID=906689 RepID=A0A2I0WGX6_9ASPA|nr:Annexin D6 [Dendrobium catenatum]